MRVVIVVLGLLAVLAVCVHSQSGDEAPDSAGDWVWDETIGDWIWQEAEETSDATEGGLFIGPEDVDEATEEASGEEHLPNGSQDDDETTEAPGDDGEEGVDSKGGYVWVWNPNRRAWVKLYEHTEQDDVDDKQATTEEATTEDVYEVTEDTVSNIVVKKPDYTWVWDEKRGWEKVYVGQEEAEYTKKANKRRRKNKKDDKKAKKAKKNKVVAGTATKTATTSSTSTTLVALSTVCGVLAIAVIIVAVVVIRNKNSKTVTLAWEKSTSEA